MATRSAALVAVNTMSVTSPGVVRLAVEKGVRVFETGGASHALSVMDAFDSSVRVIANIGYDRSTSPQRHCLEADFVEGEVCQILEKAKGRVDVILEDGDINSDFEAALTKINDLKKGNDRLGSIGVSCSNLNWVGKRKKELNLLRLPALTRTPYEELSKNFEIIGSRPLIFVDPDTGVATKLREDVSVKDLDRAATQAAYVIASEAVLTRFKDAKDSADDETRTGAEWLVQLIADLNSAIPQFPSGDDWDMELIHQIGPMLHEKFDGLDDKTADLLYAFFAAIGKVIKCTAQDRAHNIAKRGGLANFSFDTQRPLHYSLYDNLLHQRPDLSILSLDLTGKDSSDLDLVLDNILKRKENP